MEIIQLQDPGRRAKSQITTLDFRRTDFGLFKGVLSRPPWEKALERRGDHESWLIFRDELPEVQERTICS